MKCPMTGRQPRHHTTPAFTRERARRPPTPALLPWTRSESPPGSQLDPAVEAALPLEAALYPAPAAEAALGPRLAGDELAHPLAIEPLRFLDSLALAVEPVSGSSLSLDLLAEAAAVAGAAEGAQLVELLSGPVQLVCRIPAFLVERRSAVEELAVLVGEPDLLGERPTASGGVEGERLGGGAAQCFGESVDRPGGLDPVRRGVRLERVLDRVEAVVG
jgi:hypothetical protein